MAASQGQEAMQRMLQFCCEGCNLNNKDVVRKLAACFARAMRNEPAG